MKKRIYAVIVNWNGINDTLECLKSINTSNLKEYEFKKIIVDNGSTDDSLSKLRVEEKKDKNIIVLEIGRNLGFTGGNNAGIKYALANDSDYVILLNNDTLIDKNMIQNLIEGFNDENVGIVSPKIYFAKGYEFHKERYKETELGRVIWYAGGKIDWDNVIGTNMGVDEVDHGQFDKEKNIDFATGACMMVKSQVFNKIGVFNDTYFAYMEDVEFSLRVRRANYKIKFYPKAHLWHKVSKSSGIGSDLNDYFITRNRLLLGMKYASFRTRIALVKESVKFLLVGRLWQKIGVRDYFLGSLGKGSWE